MANNIKPSLCLFIFVNLMKFKFSEINAFVNNNIDNNNNTFRGKFSVRLVAIFVTDSKLPYNLELTKPAIEIAIEKAKKQYPLIEWDTPSFRKGSNKCTSNVAGVIAAEEFYLRKVTVFIGPACGLALDPVARMAAYWNIPIFSSGDSHLYFSNKKIYSTLLRMSVSLESLGSFLRQILKHFSWKHISMIINENSASPIIPSIRRRFEEALESENDIILDVHEITPSWAKVNLKKLLIECSKEAKVIIILSVGEIVRKILLTAHELNMGNGQYAFISVHLFKHINNFGNFEWFIPGDLNNEKARIMYESLLLLSVHEPLDDEYIQFKYEVIYKSRNEFKKSFNKTDVNVIVAHFHDSVLLYSQAINEVIRTGGNPKDGALILKTLSNRTFTGLIRGDVHINENGDLETDYSLNDFDPVALKMRPVIYYSGKYDMIIMGNDSIHWPGDANLPPSDDIKCGLNDNLCQENEPSQFFGIIAIVIISILIVFTIIGLIFYRKLKLESELNSMWWRVKCDEITLFEGSERSFEKLAIESSRNLNVPKIQETQQESMPKTMLSVDEGRRVTKVAPIINSSRGFYKGMKVMIKPLKVKRFILNRSALLELKQLRDFSHENLIRFIGICPEEPRISILTEYCQKGNLRDLLENDAIRIDSPFRYSLISDIIEGMCFIHASPIQYHGRLKSSNCVLNNRLVVKLTDFGLQKLRHNQSFHNTNTIDYNSLLWTAPEFLREIKQKGGEFAGSQKGDVFSFSIVLQEIITRAGPYETPRITGTQESSSKNTLNPEFIINQLQNCGAIPFRPLISPDDCPQLLIQIMTECWSENPLDRPSFSLIKQQMRKFTKEFNGNNFLENILLRMEQYANDLEKLVESKNAAFYEEKRKCEELLYEVLPRYVAEQLKQGHSVRPESFQCVTIFFSDIVDFAQLSSESKPIEIVDFLNNLYSCFDAIISNFDVYKVETIGDAYLVVSGLPIRNGNEHALQIARMSLVLLQTIQRFSIKHLPERKVQLRIGIHSGPCAAGVVGLKMPRYCIMGDTVNTASRIQSSGEANKIHISSATKAILDKFSIFKISLRGDIELKGKGLVRTYWLESECDSRIQ